MAFYYVTLPEGQGGGRKADAMIVSAADSTDAIAIAASQYSGDTGGWSGATATLLADVASNADDALVGWKFLITIGTPAGVTLEKVSFTGTAAVDTIDKIAAQLVILLDATDSIAASDYTGQLLTVSQTADDIGDHTLLVVVTPPITTDDGSERKGGGVVPIVGYVDTIVHEGSASDDLSVEFPVDAYVRPTVLHDFFTNS